MQTPPPPRVAAADRLEDGIIITFDDGKCAVYSASLLHSVLSQADAVDIKQLEAEADRLEEE